MESSLRNLTTRTALKEMFSESAPQLTLMITIILQREDVEWVTGTAVNHMFTIQRLTHGDRHCSVQ